MEDFRSTALTSIFGRSGVLLLALRFWCFPFSFPSEKSGWVERGTEWFFFFFFVSMFSPSVRAPVGLGNVTKRRG